METRLFNIHGGRPHPLRRQDLPEVARAIQAVVRGEARTMVRHAQHVRYVHIRGQSVEAVVLEEDWIKILPYIEDGTFDALLNPASARFGYLHPPRTFDEPVLSGNDPRYFERVLHILQGLFPDEYPTSDL